MQALLEQIAAAAAAAPQATQSLPPVAGRTLRVDGDYLAYWAAGNDDTDPSVAIRVAKNKLDTWMEVSRASTLEIHLTAPWSHKGHRYVLAEYQPYQAQRKGSRKPKNWGVLRDYLEQHPAAKVWTDREADDGLAENSGPDIVLVYKDKDMRQLPGLHLGWDNLTFTEVPVGAYEVTGADGLTYGTKWFLLQMLQGDTADNIKGLPKLDGKLCGPAAAEKYLADFPEERDAWSAVYSAYWRYDKEIGPALFAENAALLWLRRGHYAWYNDWYRFCPVLCEHLLRAVEEQGDIIEQFEIERKRIESMASAEATGAAEPLPTVRDDDPPGGGSGGSLPQDRALPSSTAPQLQRAPWED